MALDLWEDGVGDGNPQWAVTTDPTEEPITASEVKTYARIDGSDEDTLIESYIVAVRQAAEQYLGRALITQTITMLLDSWPGDVVKLPRPPLISITGVYTTDESDSDTVYASSNYFVQTIPEPGELVIKFGYTFPTNTERYKGGFKIIYVAGYGDADSVPNNIKEALKMWVTYIYENRVPINEPPDIAKTLLDFERIIRV